jgi:hypothetical protein
MPSQSQPVSGVIRVDMEVTHCRVFDGEDRIVQTWGYVGDYGISVCLPSDDPRIIRLLRGRRAVSRNRHR